MNNQEYNSLILKFYSQAFLQISLNDINAQDAHTKAYVITNNFVEQFHLHLGKEYLIELEEKHSTLKDKLHNYPEQFWGTNYGQQYFKKLMENIRHDIVNSILHAKENNEKIESSLFIQTAIDLMLVYEKSFLEGSQQMKLITHEFLNNKKLRAFDINYMTLLKNAFSHQHKKHILLTKVLTEFDISH